MVCCHCKEDKDVSLFYKNKKTKSGYTFRCKECSKLYINKEKRLEYERKYWGNRREDRRAQILKSHNMNKEHHKQKRQEYLKTENGQSSYRKYTQKRYALRKSAFVEDVSPIELYDGQNGICYICKGKFDFKQMELDHVMPIAKGGKHEKSNCKMACAKCNRSKGSKILVIKDLS